MTSLTFYGGVNEIGGNKILLEDKDTRVFLDFGKSFSRRARYFEEFINPRTSNGIVDFLTMGLVPDIPGVYREDLMKMAGRKPEKPEIDAVLLTHAHSDHADYISFLHEDIVFYFTNISEQCGYALLEHIKKVIKENAEEVVNSPKGKQPKPKRFEEHMEGKWLLTIRDLISKLYKKNPDENWPVKMNKFLNAEIEDEDNLSVESQLLWRILRDAHFAYAYL